jgi:predicted outer membrane repeat protein
MKKNYVLAIRSLIFIWPIYLQRIKNFAFLSKLSTLPRYALLSFFLLFTVLLQAQTIKYVTVNGAGTKDGSSWSNASDNLQKTISLSNGPTHIWIARGTYVPRVALAPNDNPQDRNNTFGLKKDVRLYGGFSGNETSLSQRNIAANETILSGNLGGGKYAHHVVLIHALEANENYYLDGLTISDGKCDIIAYYTISEVTKGMSANDRIKDKYPDWFVSMSESPYYQYTSMGLQLLGKPALPGVISVPGGDYRTTEILNTSYPKSNGGGIFNVKGVLTLNDVTFRNNSGDYGAAISLQDGAHATLTNCHFSNNRTDDHGGAITASKSSLTITGGSFSNNVSNMGAAIADLGGNLLNINNVSFTNNSTLKVKQPYRYGGAIYIEQVPQDAAQIRNINNCTFTNNSADYGGAIYADQKIRNLKITNSTFTGNSSLLESKDTALGGGGAILFHRVINAEITGNTFTNNNALKGLGGALLLMDTDGVKILNNTVSGSTAWVGGAVCLAENKNIITVSGNSFTDNSVTFANTNAFSISGLGGAMASIKDNNVQLGTNTFSRNTAPKQGGAVYFETYTVNSVINGNTFDTNSSNGFGGAIYAISLSNNKLAINNNTFDNNSAVERGGGLFLSNTIAGNVNNNLFTRNRSNIGAAVDFESSGTIHFFSNTVRSNVGVDTATQTGSIISTFDGVTKLYNNVFTKNENYTGIFYLDSKVEFVNNTVWNEVNANGFYMAGRSSVKMYNNILEELDGTSTATDVRNNSFRDDYWNKFVNKNNNIREANVYFADVANNNFNLTGCSPIINRGNNSLYLSDYANSDFTGQNRKVGTIDIGAYENESGVSGKTLPTVSPTQSFCSQDVIVNDLTATGQNIKWYSQATGGSPLASNTALVSGNTYYASQTVNGCESDRASVTVSINSTEAPTAVSPQNFIIGQPGAKIVVNGSNLKWYTQETGGTALAAAPTLNMSTENSATYWVSQTNANNCESTRTRIVVNVTKIPLIVRAANKVKVFDGNVYGNVNYTVSFSGFEDGDTQSNSVTGSLTFTGDATTATEPGVYTIIPQGITSSKYTVLFEEATLEIKSSLLLTDNTLYVKQNGTGDGSSWSSALNNLELALTRASNINSVHTDANDPRKVKKIFVAKGTYQLASGKSYVMPKDIEIYGGFDPDNGVTNLTHQRIKGDVNGGSILRGNNAPVVKNDTNSLSNTAVLNGFTITNGSAVNGAGIYNKGVAAKFENLIIKSNTASTNGGGVYNENANTTWINCLIISNIAPNGASMYNNTSLPTILNTTIADNTGTQGASLYNISGSSARIVNTISVRNSSDIVNNGSNPTYENNLIQGLNGITASTNIIDAAYVLVANSPAINTGKNNPASITLPAKDLSGKSRIIDATIDIGAFERIRSQTITATAVTKTYGDAPFTHGTASSGLPLQYTSGDINVAKIEDGKIKIVNVGTVTITASQPGNGSEYEAATATFDLTVNKKALIVTADNKSKIQDNAVFTGFTVSYDGFVSGDTPANSLTGSLVFSGSATTATATGLNYVITPSGYTSAKYNITYNNGYLTINPDISLVDGTLYVKKGATGNGTSWANALGELSEALDIVSIINAGQTTATKIFVSVGTYGSKSGQSFTMFHGVNMYGGFDPDNGITTLSHKRKYGQSILLAGSNGVSVISNNNNGLTNTDILDGFTIGGSGTRSLSQGGGIYNKNSSPTIVNCMIVNNSMYQIDYGITTYGGGIYNDNSSPVLVNCVIQNNKVGVDGNQSFRVGWGAAMYNANNSYPRLYNCSIRNNNSISQNSGNAAAIANEAGSTTTLYNSIYMNNNIGVTNGIIAYNSIIQKDDNITEGIYNNSQTVVALSEIFEGNTTALKTDSFAKDKGNNSLYTFSGLSVYDINGFNRFSNSNMDLGAEELRLTQNITAPDLTKTYGEEDFVHPSISVNSNLPLTYTASNNVNVATIKDGKIHIVATGTATITVAQTGNENYSPTQKTFVLTVGKANLIVKANDKTKIANNLVFPVANYDVTYTGFANGDDRSKLTGTLTYSGDAVNKSEVGVYIDGIMPAGLISNNYNFIYQPGTLRIVPNTIVTNKTLYVKEGTVGGDGSSWELALNDLSLALKYASILNNNTAGTVDKIYVAKGTYKPKYSIRDNSNFVDEGRDNSFLLFDGIKLYGGFDGTIANETLANRRISENKTVLDGNSVINHIVTAVNAPGSYEIDGFTFYRGAAGSAAHGSDGTVTVNGMAITREYGGAVRAANSTITIKNCTFAENSSGLRGGAFYITNNSTLLIYNTLFYGNSAYHHGALGSSMFVSNSNVKVVNSTFGDMDGDSAHIYTEGASTNLEVVNSVFNNNPSVIDIQRQAGAIAVKNSLLARAQSEYSAMTLENNLYAQPADFVNMFESNFNLQPTSIAVNKGSNALYDAVIGGNKDTAGNARFQNTIIDMGCFEAKIAQTITVANMTKKYTDADFTTGTASSGLTPLTYSSSNKNVAYITTDNKIQIVGVGQSTITVSQSGNDVYAPATATFVLTVGKGDFTPTLDARTYTYDGAEKFLNATGLPAGTTVTYTNNGQINADTYTVTATINGGEYYNDATVSNTLIINKANLSGITYNSGTFVYDGYDKHPEISGTLPEGVNVVYSNTQTNAGTYNNVRASISGDNYNLLELTTSMTITKTNLPEKQLTLDQEAVYDGTIKKLALDAVFPEGVTISYENNDNINVGTYDVIVNVNGGTNYNDKQFVATLKILKGTITTNYVLDSETFEYDGTEKSIAIAGTLPPDVTVIYTNNNQKAVGEYKVYAEISKPNYNNKIVEGTFTIIPKSIDVTLQGQLSKIYNADPFIALESDNFVLEGVVPGDDVVVLNPAAGELNNKNVGENKTVTVDNLKISGSDVKNYVLSASTLSANIGIVTVKDVAVSLIGEVTKTFDGSADAPLSIDNFKIDGFAEHDLVSLSFPATGSYDTINVGTEKTVTVDNLSITGDDASNYSLNVQSLSEPVGEISAKVITVTADASQTKVYGNTEPVLTYTFTPDLIGSDSFTGSLERAAGEDIGTYAITKGTLQATTNYSITYVGDTFEITAKPITVTANASQTKVYGETEPTLTYTVSPALVGNDTFKGVLTRAGGEDAGTYAITQGTLTAGDNYDITYAGADFEITSKTISVTADSKTKVYGEDDAALIYTFLPALVSGDSFTGSLERTAGEDVGTYTIAQGTLSAGSNYTISYTSKEYAITAKPITVTADASQTKVYGTNDPILSYSVVPALISGDLFTGSLERAAGENAGSYTIEQGSLTAGSNYEITFESDDFEITAREITIIPETSQNKVYGEADPVIAYTASEALLTGNNFSGSLSRANGNNVGTYAYTIGDLSAGDNYTLTLAATDTFVITVKPITVAADASQTKVYGETDPTLTYTVSPALVGNDTFTGVLKREIGEDVGTYAIAQGTLTAGDNYDITYAGADFEITSKTISVTADAKTKVYGEDDEDLTYTFSPALVNGESFTGSLERATGEDVGTYTIAQGTLSAGSNYTIDYTSKEYAITAKPITVTVDASQTKVYGTTDPALTYSVVPALISGDFFTGSLERAAGENAGSYTIEQGSLTAGSNYEITFESDDFEITAREITIIPETSQNKVYGEADPVIAYTTSEALLTGNNFSGSLSRANGNNVGTYAYTLGDLSAGDNYALTLVAADVFEITAKPITVAADASQTKVYGETDPTLTYTVSPALVGNDTFTGVLTRAGGEDVGTYAIAQGTLTAGANYDITYAGADFEITKADQVITWNQTLVSNCDGEATSILTATSNSGLPVSYTSSNSNVATILDDVLLYNNFGSAAITASQAGNNSYNAAEAITLPVLYSQPNLIRQQFDDVIFFDNSSKEFKSYTWYKDGVQVAGQTLQYYKETGGLNGTYHAVATKLDGTIITSCSITVTSNGVYDTIKIFPNPVRSNESYQLTTNVEPARLVNARIEVFSLNGSLVDQKITNDGETTLQAPGAEGVYIVRFTLANGKTFSKNLLVRN